MTPNKPLAPPAAPAQTATGLDASLVKTMAAQYDMQPGHFAQVIRKTVMPSAATDEQVHAFLMVCRHYRLNPLLRLIYAFPAKSGGIVPVVGIDGWLSIINDHPQYDGMTVDVAVDGDGIPVSATCAIYRKDRTHPTVVTEYYDECRRETEPWKMMPARMLRHKAIIQCARIAFALGGIFDEDEGREAAEAAPPEPIHPKPNSRVIDFAAESPAANAEADTVTPDKLPF